MTTKNPYLRNIDFPERDALLEKQPHTYYMTSHYRGYATILVRLAKISRSSLRNLEQAAQFVGAQTKKTPKKTAKKTAKKTSRRAEPRESRRS